MRQGFLLKHLNIAEFDLERALIDKVVECNSPAIQSSEPVEGSTTSTTTKSGSDTSLNSNRIVGWGRRMGENG
jgi:hypothetical protein